jgi:hypothetical protein
MVLGKKNQPQKLSQEPAPAAVQAGELHYLFAVALPVSEKGDAWQCLAVAFNPPMCMHLCLCLQNVKNKQ